MKWQERSVAETASRSDASIRFLQATLAFITCVILVIVYLLMLARDPLPIWLFWLPLLTSIALVIWQSTKANHRVRRSLVVLLEIIFLTFAMDMIFVIPVGAGVFGRDPFADVAASTATLQFGWPLPADSAVPIPTKIVAEWPLLHFLGLAASEVLGVPLFSVSYPWTVARWLPSIIAMATPLMIYSIAARLYHREDVSLIASLAASLVFFNLFFHSQYVREALGYVLFFAFILSFVMSKTSRPGALRFRTLAILLLLAVLLSHHLTFGFALVFLGLALSVPFVLRFMKIKGTVLKASASPNPHRETTALFLLGVTMFVGYLVYLGEPVFETLVQTLQSLSQPTTVVPVTQTAQVFPLGRLLLVSRAAIGVAFAYILAIGVLQRKELIYWNLMGLGWGFVTAVAAAVDLFTVTIVPVGLPRIEDFAWPLVLLPVANGVRRSRHARLGTALLILFVLINILLIPQYTYDNAATPDYALGEVSMRYSAGDYAAADWLRGGGTVVGDITTQVLFGSLAQMNVTGDPSIFQGNVSRVKGVNWFVLRAEDTTVVVTSTGTKVIVSRPANLLAIRASPTLSEIYSSGDVSIYWISSS